MRPNKKDQGFLHSKIFRNKLGFYHLEMFLMLVWAEVVWRECPVWDSLNLNFLLHLL